MDSPRSPEFRYVRHRGSKQVESTRWRKMNFDETENSKAEIAVTWFWTKTRKILYSSLVKTSLPTNLSVI